jgi:co-chaperonin GroES (HSP10)
LLAAVATGIEADTLLSILAGGDTMTSLELTPEQVKAGYRPLAGRVLLELHRHPDQIGSIIVPDSARDHSERDTAVEATVLAIGYGPFFDQGEWLQGVRPEDVKPGDRVFVMTLAKDLNRHVILTAVTRIQGVVE